MSAENPLVLLNTYVGEIVMSLIEIRAARHKAEEIFGDRKNQPTQCSANRPLVSAKQIAELFEMDATWFLTRARENRIPHVRLGKYVRFDHDEIRRYFHREAARHANS